MGLHQPADARHFPRCMVSVNRLRARRGPFPVQDWLLDSGAFTQLFRHHDYLEPPDAYADQVLRWAGVGNLLAASSEDYMCEPFILARTGKTVAEHQALTLERYRALRRLVRGRAYILPVLQGFAPEDYARHVRQYGALLRAGQWVGVGSVCKRNARPEAVVDVLRAIYQVRPDLRLHGFGLKVTAVERADVRALLHSADSMAWSFAARYEGRNANDWREAAHYVQRVEALEAGGAPPAPLPRRRQGAVRPDPSQLGLALGA